jgi:rabenosyn-5
MKEGFLCPVCLEDLESVLRLQAHFEQAHQNSEDSSAILQSFKGALGRAKKVIREDFLKKDLLAGIASGIGDGCE